MPGTAAAKEKESPNAELYELMTAHPELFRIRLGLSSERLDAPASMFGHPFLLIGLRGEPDLLDVVFEFRAETTNASGLVYAARGLSGGFKGWFQTTTLAVRSREDSEHDGRDILLDELLMSDEDVRSLARAMQAAEALKVDYYFLGENCAYRLTHLLDAAVPRWELAKTVRWPSVPSDLLRALERAHAVKTRISRPSLDRRAKEMLEKLTVSEIRTTKAIANGSLPPSAANKNVDVLEAADLLVWIDLLTTGNEALSARRHAILRERSMLESRPDPIAPRPHAPVSHKSGRARLGQGYDLNRERAYFDAEFRLGLHDLGDPPAFFSASEVEGAKLRVRGEPAGKIRFEQFEVFHLLRTESPPAFELAIGARRFRDRASPDLFAPRVKVGMGVSPFSRPYLMFALLPELELSGHPDTHGIGDSFFRADVGGSVIARATGGPLVFTTRARTAWVAFAPKAWTWEATAFLGYTLANGAAQLGFEARASQRASEGALVSSLYF